MGGMKIVPPSKFIAQEEIGREMRMIVHIGDYDVDSIILDLGSDVNILTKKTWEMMGKP